MSENLEELYIKLFPYLLRDFSTKNEINSLLINNFLLNKLLYIDVASNIGLDQANYYKSLIDNGEELKEKVKPVIEL